MPPVAMRPVLDRNGNRPQHDRFIGMTYTVGTQIEAWKAVKVAEGINVT